MKIEKQMFLSECRGISSDVRNSLINFESNLDYGYEDEDDIDMYLATSEESIDTLLKRLEYLKEKIKVFLDDNED